VLILLIALAIPAIGSSLQPQPQSGIFDRAQAAQKDSASKTRMTNVDEMAKRVDSLQFIVVYNAQLLRRDLDSKVIWIYVMLGVMIVASMMMYGALNQAQRQRRDLEERVFNTLSTSVTELETKIKQVESEIVSHAPPKRAAAPKKKK
jgi:outer membrane murein-binding lipoprotein Lpp